MAEEDVDRVLVKVKSARDGAVHAAAETKAHRVRTAELLAEIRKPETKRAEAVKKAGEARVHERDATLSAGKANRQSILTADEAERAKPDIADLEENDRKNATAKSDQYVDDAQTAADNAKKDADIAKGNADQADAAAKRKPK